MNVIGQHLVTVLWTNLDICDELVNDYKPLMIILSTSQDNIGENLSTSQDST